MKLNAVLQGKKVEIPSDDSIVQGISEACSKAIEMSHQNTRTNIETKGGEFGVESFETYDLNLHSQYPLNYTRFQYAYKYISWIRAAIDARAMDVSEGVLELYAENPNRRIKKSETEYLRSLLMQPNEDQTWNQFSFMTCIWLEINDDAYWEIIRKNGIPAALHIINPTTIKRNINKNGKLIDNSAYIQYNDYGQVVNKWKKRDIIHFRRNGDGLYGLSPMTSLIDTMDSYKSALRYNRMFFENNATPRLVVMLPDGTDIDRRKLVQLVRQQRGRPHSSIVLTYENAKGKPSIEPLGLSNSEMEFLSMLRWDRDEILAIYKVPPCKVAVMETGKMSNPTLQLAMFRESIMSEQKLICATIKNRLIEQELGYQNIGIRIRNTNPVDEIKHQSMINDQVDRGMITVNEWRAENGKPVVPWGNKPLYFVKSLAENLAKSLAENGETDTSYFEVIQLDDFNSVIGEVEKNRINKKLLENLGGGAL